MQGKRIFLILIVSLFFLSLLIGLTSCAGLCGGYGYLGLRNTSGSTVQRIRIDGVNYGTLNPGQTNTYKLAVGLHMVETINNRTGHAACNDFWVTIVECETSGFDCSG